MEQIGEERAYPTYDGIVAGEMGLAVLATEDLVGVEVDVVCEPHPGRLGAEERREWICGTVRVVAA